MYRTRLSSGDSWREVAIRPTMEYYPNGRLTLETGAYYFLTRQTDESKSRELRPILGVTWNVSIPEKRFHLSSRALYEYRFFFGENDQDDISRIRVNAKLIISLTRPNYSQDKNLYAIIEPELFFNFEENSIIERYKSRFRQEVGLGYRFNYPWRLEISYIYQESRNSTSNDSPDNSSSIISTVFRYKKNNCPLSFNNCFDTCLKASRILWFFGFMFYLSCVISPVQI